MVHGKPKMMGKIFGGQDTLAGQWPWQAGLLYHGLHLCGAVLIDSRWVVSTAHCFQKDPLDSPLCLSTDTEVPQEDWPPLSATLQAAAYFTLPQSPVSPIPGKDHTWPAASISQAPENYQVLLGNTQLYQQSQHTQKIPVNRIINHPDFEKFHPFGRDVAMLQLRLPVNFTFYEGEVVLIENEFCNTLYGRRPGEGQDYVHEDMLCAGGLSTGKSISGVILAALSPASTTAHGS